MARDPESDVLKLVLEMRQDAAKLTGKFARCRNEMSRRFARINETLDAMIQTSTSNLRRAKTFRIVTRAARRPRIRCST
jgi:hypothetical protein